MAEGECAATNKVGSLHIRFEPASKPRTQHKPIHLVERYLRVLEDGRPTKTLDVEPS
jgi:hypothetical protein